MIANLVYQDGAFGGICFPGRSSSFNEAVIHVIKKHLEAGGDPVLYTYLQWLYLSMIVLPVVGEVYWEFVEHSL